MERTKINLKDHFRFEKTPFGWKIVAKTHLMQTVENISELDRAIVLAKKQVQSLRDYLGATQVAVYYLDDICVGEFNI